MMTMSFQLTTQFNLVSYDTRDCLWKDNLNALWNIFSDVSAKKDFVMGVIRLVSRNCIIALFREDGICLVLFNLITKCQLD
jgi:hypothetical protein